EFGGAVLSTCRDWVTTTFASEQAHGLLAPWVLHTGLGPDQALSGFMTQVIANAVQLGGMPVPKDGGSRLVDGLAAIVRDAGGELRSEAEVERILVSDGRATAVRLAGGETVQASRRLARRQRGRARPTARRGDRRLRPAVRGRPLTRSGRRLGDLDPAPGGSLTPEGRRGRRARRRRRSLDGGAPRSLRRPRRRPAR